MHSALDVAAVRRQFPALVLADGGKPRLYLDNPAGTQVPQRVIDRTVETLIEKNANLGGYFRTTVDADAMVAEAHQAVADLYGASSAEG